PVARSSLQRQPMTRHWSDAPPALVPPVAGVAHDPGHAVTVVDDDRTVAHLDIAVVDLGDGDALAVVPLHRHFHTAAGRVLVDRGAGDGAADRTQHAADHGAAHRTGGGATNRRAARGAQAAADQGAIARPGVAGPDRHLADRDDAA